MRTKHYAIKSLINYDQSYHLNSSLSNITFFKTVKLTKLNSNYLHFFNLLITCIPDIPNYFNNLLGSLIQL